MTPKLNELFHIRETGATYEFVLVTPDATTYHLHWTIRKNTTFLGEYRLTFKTEHAAILAKEALKTVTNFQNME